MTTQHVITGSQLVVTVTEYLSILNYELACLTIDDDAAEPQ